jgi:hypothetical protein
MIWVTRFFCSRDSRSETMGDDGILRERERHGENRQKFWVFLNQTQHTGTVYNPGDILTRAPGTDPISNVIASFDDGVVEEYASPHGLRSHGSVACRPPSME